MMSTNLENNLMCHPVLKLMRLSFNLLSTDCSDNYVQRAAVGDQLRGPAAQQQRRGPQVPQPKAVHGHSGAAALCPGKEVALQMVELGKSVK